MLKYLLGLTAAMAVVPAQVASAALLAEETFSSYAAGTYLGGLAGGSGWGAAWQVGNAPDKAYAGQVRDGAPLSYPNYTASTTPALSGGNYANIASGFGSNVPNYAVRDLDVSGAGTFGSNGYLTTNAASQTVVGADGTTLWGSFVYAGGGALELWLRNPGVGDQKFGLPGGAGNSLVLFQIEYLAGNDNINFWINPDLSTWSPSTAPTGAASGSYLFSTFILFENGTDFEFRFDDTRFGSSASDVAPVVPEPTTMAGLAMIGFALLRRSR